MRVKAISDEAICAWVHQFSKDEGVVNELIDKRQSVYFAATLFSTVSRLMIACRTFNMTEVTSITHEDKVHSANFSADGRYVVTASNDKTAKIYGQDENGEWVEKATIFHDHIICSATFSADGCYIIIASEDNFTKIYGQGKDGNWTEKTTIFNTHDLESCDGDCLRSATFSADGRYVVIASNDKTAKIWKLTLGDNA